MVDFRDVVSDLIDIGFYDIFLPFILVYAVIFAILQKSGIFEGKEGDAKNVRSVNAVVALVFAMFVVASIQTVRYIQDLLTNVVVFIMFILAALIVLGFIFGRDWYKELLGDEGSGRGIKAVIAAVIFLVILGFLFATIGLWDWIRDEWDFSLSGGDISTFVVIVLIIAVIVWITVGTNPSNKDDN